MSNKIKEEQRRNVIDKIKELISSNGQIDTTEDLGEKKLAYEIKKHKKALNKS